MFEIDKAPKVEVKNKTLGNDVPGFIVEFYNVLKGLENANDTLFFNNVDSLEVYEASEDEMSSRFALAEYSVEKNFIRYVKNKFKVAISHELLHLSSSYRTDDCQYSGFSQFHREGNRLLGIGLNEGYTCILDERYFGDYVEEKRKYLESTYAIVKQICLMLDELVGPDNMEKWYFEADLDSLVNYLTQFRDYEEVICFVLALDNIFFYCDEGKRMRPNITMSNYRYAVEFIGKCYVTILSEEFVQGNITKEKYDEVMGYVYQLMSRVLKFKRFKIIGSRKMNKKIFNSLVEEEMDKAIKKYT